MNLENEFVPYEQALALKELGFNEPCFAGYDIDTTELYIGYEDNQRTFNIDYHILAPTFSQAFRWFREKHRLYSVIIPKITPSNKIVYYIYEGKHKKNWEECFDTYEDAELESLKKLIEIVKTK